MGEEREGITHEGLTAEELQALWDGGAGHVYVSFATGEVISEAAYTKELSWIVDRIEHYGQPFATPFDPQHPVAHVSEPPRVLLHEWCGILGWTASELAARVGLKGSTLNSYLYGERRMPLRVFAHLVDVFAVEMMRCNATGGKAWVFDFYGMRDAKGLLAWRVFCAERMLGKLEANERRYTKEWCANQRRVAKCLYIAMRAAVLPADQLQTLLSVVQMADGETYAPAHVLPDDDASAAAARDVLSQIPSFAEEQLDSMGAITYGEFSERAQAALEAGDGYTMEELLRNLLFTMSNRPEWENPPEE